MNDPSPPQGQRMLAAIVFTDVVGFTTLAGLDEQRALRLLSRDTDLIRSVAETNGAIFSKGTGDGMLLVFPSAVEAVRSAIQIQEQIAERAKSLPSNDVMRHRIGIHLGDVLVFPNDVVGDGVNLASRLQSEARPGGIGLSSTVYDVVRGKLNFRATSLGPRNLAGVVDAVNVWLIHPESDAAPPTVSHSVAGSGSKESGLPLHDEHPRGFRLLAVVFGIAACLIALAFVIQTISRGGAPAPAVVSSPRPGEAGRTIPGPGDQTPGAPPEEKPQEEPPIGVPPAREPAAPATDPEPEPDAEVDRFLVAYEFDAAADALERQPNLGPRGPERVARLRRLALFRNWIESGLRAATEAAPLIVSGGGDPGDVDYAAWTNTDGKFMLRSNDEQRAFEFRELLPRELLRLGAAILKRGGATLAERTERREQAREFIVVMRLRDLPSNF